MSLAAANEWLRAHPQRERWRMLTIGPESPLRDEDLALLEHVPELTHVRLRSPNFGDAAIGHLRCLPGLKMLELFTRNLTDACPGEPEPGRQPARVRPARHRPVDEAVDA